ncbi:hypothetical protein GQ457_04G029110 [Hibiscus cannabinus]
MSGYYNVSDNVKLGFPMAFTTTMLARSVIEFRHPKMALELLPSTAIDHHFPSSIWRAPSSNMLASILVSEWCLSFLLFHQQFFPFHIP